MNMITTPSKSPALDDGLGITYEIVEGERVEFDMGAFEMSVANILHNALSPFCLDRLLGRSFVEMWYRMRPDHPVTKPDVSFVSYAKWPQRRGLPRNKEAWHIVPEMVAEVISPNDKMSEVMAKLRRYFEAGVQTVWHVMPFIESVYVYESPKRITAFDMADQLEYAALFSGWKLPVATLFPPEAED